MTINQRLFLILENKGIDASDLARGTGIKANVISDWKTKGTNPRADKIGRICDFLGVSCDYLLTGKKDIPNVELSKDELDLLAMYNGLDLNGKVAVVNVIKAEQERIEAEKNSNGNTKVG